VSGKTAPFDRCGRLAYGQGAVDGPSRSQLYPLLRRVNSYLRRWAARKYKRLWAYKRFKKWWAGIQQREPGLFAQWQWSRAT